MPDLKELLNKIKWTEDINKTEIWYIHRGAPNNTKIIYGEDIKKIEKSSLETKKSTIPYHRIFKIIYDKKIIFER